MTSVADLVAMVVMDNLPEDNNYQIIEVNKTPQLRVLKEENRDIIHDLGNDNTMATAIAT